MKPPLSLGSRLAFRIERHPLGPRIFFLGLRWHDWHLGLIVLFALGVGALAGVFHDAFPTLLAGIAGVWLISKDWRDLTRARRDTAAWRLGLHRHPHPLRTLHRADPLPALVALAAASIATVDLFSALTPNIGWRGHLLLKIGAVEELRVFHAVAIPVAVVLFASAYYLARRRLRALHLAVALLLALALFNLLKGLDFEEAAGDFGVALVLWFGRGSFYVEHELLGRRAALIRAPLVAAAGFLSSLAVVAIAARMFNDTIARETTDLLLWRHGPIAFHDELGRLDLAVGLVGVATALVVGYLIFRPLAAPRDLPDPRARAVAAELVRAHGSDTLAYFKLRRDKHYLFTADLRAFLGYRIESGVMIVSGEPVGPADAVPELLERLAGFAERRDLRIAAVGVGEELKPSFEQLGLHAFYVGDEAIVETREFSLEGRGIRKVRQSVSRLEAAGYTSTVIPVGALGPSDLQELENIGLAWLGDEPERGFSMALDRPFDEHDDTFLLAARDAEGRIRAYLHFVPSYGRSAVSLSAMRRSDRTPNGLTEYMIVSALNEFRARGVEEVSLNFAAFARLLHSPEGFGERLLGRALRTADSFFQIERLYRFNAKFSPRWHPRYLMYEGAMSLPRTAIATLWVEGQLQKPRIMKRATRSHSRA